MASTYPGEQSKTAKQPVTEMAFLNFPPQTRLHDPSTEAGTIWRRVLKDVSMAEGFCSQIWGYETTAPGTVWYLVEWISVEAHTTYATTPEYSALNETLFPLFMPSPPAPLPWMVHIRFPDNHVWDKGTVRVLRFWVPLADKMVKVEKSIDVAVTHMRTQTNGQLEQNGRDLISVWAEGLVAPDADLAECRLFVIAYRYADSDHDSGEDIKLRRSLDSLKQGLKLQVVKCEESTVTLQDAPSG